jgi:hypothetical protein
MGQSRSRCDLRTYSCPLHAYLDAFGRDWQCDRGYRKSDESCVAIDVPPHGYLVDGSYGSGWKCERGYNATNDACVAIKVPEHGYLTDSRLNPDGAVIEAIKRTTVRA